MANRYLFVVAHPDDEVLGAGATIRKLVDEGNEVRIIILNADFEISRPNMAEDLIKSKEVLGIDFVYCFSFENMGFVNENHRKMVREIEKCIADFKPHYIFTHSPDDLHSDHKITNMVCLQAARFGQRNNKNWKVKGLYYFEVLSSTDWGVLPFEPNCFVGVNKQQMDAKIKALEVYKNVLRPTPHPRRKENIFALATYRGSQIGYKYAEGFKLIWRDDL